MPGMFALPKRRTQRVRVHKSQVIEALLKAMFEVQQTTRTKHGNPLTTRGPACLRRTRTILMPTPVYGEFAGPDLDAESHTQVRGYRRVVPMTQARGEIAQRRQQAQDLNNSVVKYRSMRSAKTVTTCGFWPPMSEAACCAAR